MPNAAKKSVLFFVIVTLNRQPTKFYNIILWPLCCGHKVNYKLWVSLNWWNLYHVGRWYFVSCLFVPKNYLFIYCDPKWTRWDDGVIQCTTYNLFITKTSISQIISCCPETMLKECFAFQVLILQILGEEDYSSEWTSFNWMWQPM